MGQADLLVEPIQEVSAVWALSAMDPHHSHQADQDLALELRFPITSPVAHLDLTPSSLLAHQEAPASAPLACLEALASVPQVESPASTLDRDHTEPVPDQVVRL